MNLIFCEESGELVAQCPRCKSTHVEHINAEEAVYDGLIGFRKCIWG